MRQKGKVASITGAGEGNPSRMVRPSDKQRNIRYDQETVLVMKRCLRRNSNCVDVGCHRGKILAEILRVAPLGTHLAFEPIPHLYRELVNTYGSRPNISLFELALSDASGERPFHHVVTNSGYSGFRRRRYDRPNEVVEEMTVKSAALDTIVPDGLPIQFIKIDVEGAELQVMRGAVETIKRHKPTIVFEHGLGAADCYGTTPEDVYAFLTAECGLRLFLMDHWLRGAPSLARQEFAKQFHRGINFCFMAHE